jgi:LCP family protein required for cell wall assembly
VSFTRRVTSRSPRAGTGRALVAGLAFLIVALTGVVLLRAGAGVAASPSPGATANPLGTPAIELHAVHGAASFVPALQGQRPLFILALGSDARPGEQIERERSDSIHIIGINLATHHATILGFPRDSWVHIPGHGTDKINSALVYGGPELMAKTLESITGLRIDFWLLTSFPGLVAMVNGIGGLTVRVPFAMSDPFSHAHFSRGVHHMTGKQALAFARDRHDPPRGDLDRSHDQGILFVSALSKLHVLFQKDPGVVFNWLAVGWQHVHTDLPVSTLLQLALTASQVDPKNVVNIVVPATTGQVGSASVVFILGSAKSVYADMRADGVVSGR